MTEQEVMKWMRSKIEKDGFDTAAKLAEQFLGEHHITEATDPKFTTTINAGFKIAEELYGISDD